MKMNININSVKKKKMLSILLVFLFVSMFGYLIILLNTTSKGIDNASITEHNQFDDDIEIVKKKDFIEIDLSKIGLTEYKAKNYDISFKYPSDFDLVYEKTKWTYENGEKWDQIFFESNSRKQNARFSLEVNPDGIGLPVDKKFTVNKIDGIGDIILVDDYSGDKSLEDDVNILSASWEEGGDWLQLTFSYDTDVEPDNIDYEKMFMDILKTFVVR